jgi:membrane protease YdiL (CAAX protease family)
MLLIATNRKNWDERFGFWAVKVINAKVLVKWLIVGLFFWLISSYLGELLNLPIEQFMLDVKSASNSLGVVILMVVTICLLVPVMEELVFRGWLYSKIAQTKLGNIGALFLSSILFTTIHTQYDNAITLMIIFSLGLLLGGVRYKSGNISYSIAIHILFNSLATIALFFFL